MTALQIQRDKNLEDKRIAEAKLAEESRHNKATERTDKIKAYSGAANPVLASATKFLSGGINDLDWHVSDKTLLQQSAGIAWGLPIGAQATSIDQNFTPAGIMTARFMFTPGSTFVGTPGTYQRFSNVNQIAGDFMARVWENKSGTPPFQKSDLWQYIYAVANGYMLHAALVKLVGILNMDTDVYNQYIRDGLLSSYGYSAATIPTLVGLKNELAAMANDFALRLAKYQVPDDMPVFKYAAWLCSKLAIDTDGGYRGQLYHMIPHAYYVYDWTGKRLTATLFSQITSNSAPLVGWRTAINNVIDGLDQNDDTYVIMRAAITQAFKDKLLVGAGLIDNNYVQKIEKDAEFLGMFRNIQLQPNWADVATLSLPTVTQEALTGELQVTAQVVINGTGSGGIAKPLGALIASQVNKGVMLNTDIEFPTPADTMLMTRFVNWYSHQTKHSTTGAITAQIGFSEVFIVGVTTTSYSWNLTKAKFSIATSPVYGGDLYDGESSAFSAIGYLIQIAPFYYSPAMILYGTDSTGSSSDGFWANVCNNLDCYTKVSQRDLQAMAAVDIMAQLGWGR